MSHRDDSKPDSVPLARALWCITIFAVWSLALSATHALFPLRFDLLSTVIAEIGVVPLLVFLFQNVEFGFGDYKLALKPNKIALAFAQTGSLTTGVQGTSFAAFAAVPGASAAVAATPSAPEESANALAVISDNMVFVRLRRDIELRLQQIAEAFGVPSQSGVAELLAELRGRGIVAPAAARGLSELIKAGNAQAHGFSVQGSAADLARIEGPRLLASLDSVANLPWAELGSRILAAAQAAGKTTELVPRGSPYGYGADISLGKELAIEVKPPQLNEKQRTFMFSQALRYAKNNEFAALLFVFTSKPDWSSAAGPDQFQVGIAWLADGSRFEGDAVARKLAPWLFEVPPGA